MDRSATEGDSGGRSLADADGGRALHRAAAVADFKRHLLREAAYEVFAEHGLAGASVRRITSSAGYTTSALYTYYGGKEELYGDILRTSMAELLERLRAARATAEAGEEAAAVLRAVLAFYLERPRDFDLSFHLHGGTRPSGLTKELDRELNDQMRGIVGFVGEAVAASGHGDRQDEVALGAMALSHVFGLVLMANTGRLSLLGVEAHDLLDGFLSGLHVPAGVRGR